MSKHTSGPWAVFNQSDVFTNRNDGKVSEYIADCALDEMELSEIQANANLIAAAPDLYEAVAAVIDATRDYLPPDGITKDEFISRVIAATDNARVVEIMK